MGGWGGHACRYGSMYVPAYLSVCLPVYACMDGWIDGRMDGGVNMCAYMSVCGHKYLST